MSVRDLNQVPFNYIIDQLNVRLAGELPVIQYESMQDLKKAKTQDGDGIELTPAEQKAIFLRADNLHVIYPSTMTPTQIKVFEQFRGLPIDYTNTYKLVRTKIYSLSQEIGQLKNISVYTTTKNNLTPTEFQKEVNIKLFNVFHSLEAYLNNPIERYLQGARRFLSELLNDLNIFNIQGSKSEEMKYTKVNELAELLSFLNDCTNDSETYIPHLLMPCSAFPSIPIKSERVTNLFIDSRNCLINGFDILINKIESVTVDKLKKEEVKSDKPQKKSKAKKQNETNLARTNCEKPIKDFVSKITKIFNDWKKYYATIYDKSKAIEWTRCLAQAGCVRVIDKSQITLHSPEEYSKRMMQLLKEIQSTNAKYDEFIGLHQDEINKAKGSIKTFDKVLKCDNDTLISIKLCFNTMIRQNHNTVCKVTSYPLAYALTLINKRNEVIEKLECFYLNLKSNIYKSPYVTPLDCMVHACVEKLIVCRDVINTSFQEKLKGFDDTAQRFVSIFSLLSMLINELNLDSIDYVNNTELAHEHFKNIDGHISEIKATLSALEKSSTEPLSSHCKYLASMMEAIESLTENCKALPETYYPILLRLAPIRGKDLSTDEIDSDFVKNCLDYNSWCLKMFNGDKLIYNTGEAITAILNFQKLIQDENSNELLKEIGDFSFFNAVKLVEWFRSMELYFIELNKKVNRAKLFLKGPREEPTYKTIQKWIPLERDMEDVSRRVPKYTHFVQTWHHLMNLVEVDGESINFEYFVIKSDRHESIFKTFADMTKAIIKWYDLLADHCVVTYDMTPALNSTLVKYYLDKENIKSLEKYDRQRGQKTYEAFFYGNKDETENDEVKSEKEIKQDAVQSETIPTQPLIRTKSINPCLIPVIRIRAYLKGLASQPSQEHVVNSLHYSTQIYELLDKYSQANDWHDSALLSFLSKSTLVLEQALKYGLSKLNHLLNDEMKELLAVHDVMALWDLYQTLTHDQSLILNPSDRYLLQGYNAITKTTSRYPLSDTSSPILTPFVNVLKKKKDLFLAGQGEGHDIKSDVALYLTLRETGMRLLELSLNIWKKEGTAINEILLDLPAYRGPVVPGENFQAALIGQCSQLHKASIGNRLNANKILSTWNIKKSFDETCRDQFQTSCQSIEGALAALSELLSKVECHAAPYAVADAILMHASTLLEQASLALISRFNIRDLYHDDDMHILCKSIKNGTPKRWWRHSHNIFEYLQTLQGFNGIVKLSEEQYEHVKEMTRFLAVANHYPAAGSGSLCIALDNLRKWSELKSHLIFHEGFLPLEETKWCVDKFGLDHHSWVSKIDVQIKFELNKHIFSRAFKTLEIASLVLEDVHKLK